MKRGKFYFFQYYNLKGWGLQGVMTGILLCILSCSESLEYREAGHREEYSSNNASAPAAVNSASVLDALILSGMSEESHEPLLKEKISAASKHLPLRKLFENQMRFVENKGQLERFGDFSPEGLRNVRFYTKAFSGTAYFAENGIGFGFLRGGLEFKNEEAEGREHVRMSREIYREQTGFYIEFEGSNENVSLSGSDPNHTKINYLKGNNPGQFLTGIQTYNRIEYQTIYPGINLTYYTKENQLKYDYILQPGADVKQIRMKYRNVKDVHVNRKGELEVEIDWGVLLDKKPYSYQLIDGVEKEVAVKYILKGKNTIGFSITGKYDPAYDLIIDPFTVEWSTYIATTGAGDNGYIESTCVDNSGRVLGTGWVNSSFPINASPNGYRKSHSGAEDVFVFRLTADGTALDYVTYMGGSAWEVGTGIRVNTAGDICVTGYTESREEIIPIDNTNATLTIGTGSMNIAVPAIAPYGMGWVIKIQYDATNYMVGTITGFPNGTTITVNVTETAGSGTYSSWSTSRWAQMPYPTTSGCIQPAKVGNNAIPDIFYSKLNGSGNTLLYSTHYGGTDTDRAYDLALDNNDNAYITGRTQSSGLGTAGVYLSNYAGAYDSFVLKINSNGTLGYFTYIGGSGTHDVGKGIDVNSAGEAFVTGITASSGLGSAGAYRTTPVGGNDAFLIKLTPAGGLGFFTYLGGTAMDGGAAVKVLPNGEPVVMGTTASSNFPLINAFDNTYSGEEAFLTRFTSDGSALRYSTFIGGSSAENTKGFDFEQYHKMGGLELVNGMPIVVFSTSSTPASMTHLLVDAFSFTAVDNSGTNYTYDGSAYGGGLAGIGDMFIVVLDSTAQNVLYGSYYGGGDNDYPTAGVNIDRNTACVIMAGGVHSTNFPVTPGSFQTVRNAPAAADVPAIVKICLPELLPVELLRFNAMPDNGFVRLDWTTANETDNSHFEVERSTDGRLFTKIGRVEGSGNTSDFRHYGFNDYNHPSGKLYYRLRQVDFNGAFNYSIIRAVNIISLQYASVYPNPNSGSFQIRGYLHEAGLVFYQVIDITGRTLDEGSLDADAGDLSLSIELSDSRPGMYIIMLQTVTDQTVLKMVVE